MIETYSWRGGTEFALRCGVGSPVTLLILPALFEEANRMRRLTVSMMRALANEGIGTILPDLPGTGESPASLTQISLDDWHAAASSLATQVSGSVAIRAGALLDGPFAARWRLAPETGARILRDLVRATAFAQGVAADDIDARVRHEPTRLAGTLVGPALYEALAQAVPADVAHVTAVEGPKLWRAAEPGDDPAFARALAQDIALWVKTCVA